MRSKKIIFFIIILFLVLFINTSSFATIDFTYDNNNYIMPDYPTINNLQNKEYLIYRTSRNYILFVMAWDNSNIYFQDNYLRCSNLARLETANNGFDCSNQNWDFSNWRFNGNLSISDTNFLIYSTFDILDNNGNVYFESSVKPVIPEKVLNTDTLYIGDIPAEYCYAQFNSDYVTLFNQSNANNEDLNYYRIYFIDNGFYYDKGVIHFSENVSFQKINVSNKIYYRRDFPNILLTTFIIVIFFLWVTNLFTTIIYKGGILHGLL